jgi:hypothetical protein
MQAVTPPPAPATPPPAAGPKEPDSEAGGETIEYDVEAEHAAEERDRISEHDQAPAEERTPGHEREDVLEETPEFLQDTPDHDRLWFEQKPPKDFDFDG